MLVCHTVPSSNMAHSPFTQQQQPATTTGCGGSIKRFLLEKRSESMRVRAAAGLSTAARRKPAPSGMSW